MGIDELFRDFIPCNSSLRTKDDNFFSYIAHPHTGLPTEYSLISSVMRILLAEDNAVNRKLIVKMLSILGYAAATVTNGAEAVDMLKDQVFDVIIMDVNMPVMDGLEATRQIRKVATASGQPYIIALTADTVLDVKHKCMEAGMDDYVSKPISLELLRDAIARAQALPGTPD